MFKRVLTMVPTSRDIFPFSRADNKEILISKKEKAASSSARYVIAAYILRLVYCLLIHVSQPQRGGVPAPALLASLDAAARISAMLVRCGGGGVMKQENKRIILEDA